MSVYSETLRGGGIAFVYLGIFAVSEIWHRWQRPAVEVTRKFVHLASGITALTLSWVIDSLLTLAVLCGGFVALVATSRRLGLLPSVQSVTRQSMGDIYFPIAIFLTFSIASYSGQSAYYSIALLVLAVADSSAALIGRYFGRIRFVVQDEQKSMEGCGLFFLATFTIVHFGLLLLTDLGPAATVLSALYVALLVTCVESLCLSGADNLFIPLAVIAILLKITTKTVSEMLWQNCLILLDFSLVAVMLLPRKNLSLSAVLGLGLLTYGTHALVGLSWAYLLFLAIALYSASGFTVPDSKGSYRIKPTFYMCLLPLGWLLLTNYLALDIAAVLFPAFGVTVIGGVHLLLELTLRENLPGAGWTNMLKAEGALGRVHLPGWLAIPARGLVLTLVLGSGHHWLEPDAVWWFNLPALFVADCVLIIPALHILAARRGLIRRIQYCSLWGALVSTALFLLSWQFHLEVA